MSQLTIKERLHLLELQTSQARLRIALNKGRSVSPAARRRDNESRYNSPEFTSPTSAAKLHYGQYSMQSTPQISPKNIPVPVVSSPDSIAQVDEVELVSSTIFIMEEVVLYALSLMILFY